MPTRPCAPHGTDPSSATSSVAPFFTSVVPCLVAPSQTWTDTIAHAQRFKSVEVPTSHSVAINFAAKLCRWARKFVRIVSFVYFISQTLVFLSLHVARVRTPISRSKLSEMALLASLSPLNLYLSQSALGNFFRVRPPLC